MLQFSMKYIDWFIEHSKKHRAILKSLEGKSKDEIIEYFDYENMRTKHPYFCPLYASNSKCHDMKKLNCYICGCPYFRFDDDGLCVDNDKNIVYSYCIKDLGDKFTMNGKTHHDCSKCTLPHTKKFINDNFDLDWGLIMKDVMVFRP